MSTSSGRKGWCTRCPHLMNEHTKTSSSRCKRCSKVFDICQCMVHGYANSFGVDTSGWRICYRPCQCGTEFYPDVALAARDLEPWEYRTDHPGYHPMEDFFSYDLSQEVDSSMVGGHEEEYDESEKGDRKKEKKEKKGKQRESQEQSMADLTDQFAQADIGTDTTGPTTTPVQPYIKKGSHIYFDYDGTEIKTTRSDWTWLETYSEDGELLYYYQYIAADGNIFYTYDMPSKEHDEDYDDKKGGKSKGKGKTNEDKERSKGKSKGKG